MSFIPHVICVELWDLIKIDINWTKKVECSFIRWFFYHIVAEFMGFIIRYNTTNNASKVGQQSKSDPLNCQPRAIGIEYFSCSKWLLFCLIQSFYLTNDLIKVSLLYLTVFYFVFFRAFQFHAFRSPYAAPHWFHSHTYIHTGIPSYLIVIGLLKYYGFTICLCVWSYHVLLLTDNSETEP